MKSYIVSYDGGKQDDTVWYDVIMADDVESAIAKVKGYEDNVVRVLSIRLVNEADAKIYWGTFADASEYREVLRRIQDENDRVAWNIRRYER